MSGWFRWPLFLFIALVPMLLCAGVHEMGGVLQSRSHFGFRAVVEGEAFDAVFRRFDVRPLVDDRHRPLGFSVEVDLRGTDSGDVDRDAEMRGADWFDVRNHPFAVFESHAIDVVGGNLYRMRGELTVKGVTRTLAIPFTWQRDANRFLMSGGVDLDRRSFGIGPDDVSSVAADVRVVFELSWLIP